MPKEPSKPQGKSPQSKSSPGKGQGHDVKPKSGTWVVKPGQKTPQSGIYSPSKGGSEVALSKGDRVPPTKKGGTFVLKAATKKTGSVWQVGGDPTGSPPPPPPKDGR